MIIYLNTCINYNYKNNFIYVSILTCSKAHNGIQCCNESHYIGIQLLLNLTLLKICTGISILLLVNFYLISLNKCIYFFNLCIDTIYFSVICISNGVRLM